MSRSAFREMEEEIELSTDHARHLLNSAAWTGQRLGQEALTVGGIVAGFVLVPAPHAHSARGVLDDDDSSAISFGAQLGLGQGDGLDFWISREAISWGTTGHNSRGSVVSLAGRTPPGYRSSEPR